MLLDKRLTFTAMMKIKLGTTQLHVTYTDDELKTKVLDYIDSKDDGVGFRDICDNILTFAEDEGKLSQPEAEQYQWMELDRTDILRIDAILNDAIAERRIMIDFNTTHYQAADTYFIKR